MQQKATILKIKKCMHHVYDENISFILNSMKPKPGTLSINVQNIDNFNISQKF